MSVRMTETIRRDVIRVSRWSAMAANNRRPPVNGRKLASSRLTLEFFRQLLPNT
jgi:hypothetical protein